jgi:hypothetical protein
VDGPDGPQDINEALKGRARAQRTRQEDVWKADRKGGRAVATARLSGWMREVGSRDEPVTGEDAARKKTPKLVTATQADQR